MGRTSRRPPGHRELHTPSPQPAPSHPESDRASGPASRAWARSVHRSLLNSLGGIAIGEAGTSTVGGRALGKRDTRPEALCRCIGSPWPNAAPLQGPRKRRPPPHSVDVRLPRRRAVLDAGTTASASSPNPHSLPRPDENHGPGATASRRSTRTTRGTTMPHCNQRAATRRLGHGQSESHC